MQILHVSQKTSLSVLGAGYNGGETQLGAHVTVTSDFLGVHPGLLSLLLLKILVKN